MSVTRRRFNAIILDNIVLAPLWLWAMQYDVGVKIFALALTLAYFHICESTSGQTVGKAVFKLRVVTLDGQIAGDRASAARTVIRLFEEPFIALIAMFCNGRRQRLGDLAAGTIVVDAREVEVSKPLTAGALGYPAAWIVPALIVCVLSAQGNFPGSYRVEADRICEEADSVVPSLQHPQQLADLTRAETARLAALDAPRNWPDRHDVRVGEDRRLSRKLSRAVRRSMRSGRPDRRWQKEWPRLQRLAEQSNVRLAQLGYKGCAGESSAA